MVKNINQMYMVYSDSLVYKILIYIVPDKFLKAITYNAIIDTKESIIDDLVKKELNSSSVDQTIVMTVNNLLDSYDLKEL